MMYERCRVEPLIMDTLKSGQPPYNGQTVCPCLYIVHTFLPPKKGQPLNNGQKSLSPTCPLFGGSTVLQYYRYCITIARVISLHYQYFTLRRRLNYKVHSFTSDNLAIGKIISCPPGTGVLCRGAPYILINKFT